MKKYYIGYTAGVFDMFHIGHLNLLKQAKELCDILIVGVNSDSLVLEYKNKKTIINEEDRKNIVNSIKFVDKAAIVNTLDKVDALKRFRFDALFIGDDWKGNPRWIETEKQMKKRGVDVIYLSRTKGISSTELKAKLETFEK